MYNFYHLLAAQHLRMLHASGGAAISARHATSPSSPASFLALRMLHGGHHRVAIVFFAYAARVRIFAAHCCRTPRKRRAAGRFCHRGIRQQNALFQINSGSSRWRRFRLYRRMDVPGALGMAGIVKTPWQTVNANIWCSLVRL